MKRDRLLALLRAIRGRRILVAGDYFLDKYLVIDPRLQERSLETGRPAHQVVNIRLAPGGAGTVASNLAALGALPLPLGLVGNDGEGWELIEGLRTRGIASDWLLRSDRHRTGTYVKPMRKLRHGEGEVETERLDLRRREPIEPQTERRLVSALREASRGVDAIIVVDAVPDDSGVITARLRNEIARLGKQKLILIDSRRHIGAFRNAVVKPNLREAAAAVGRRRPARAGARWVNEVASALYAQTNRPLFVTAEAQGIYFFDGRRTQQVAALPPRGPIDVVGAGDCVAASLCAALAAGASLGESAEFANLAASVTIHKLGTTGTASPREIVSLNGKVDSRRSPVAS